ncbi:MAG: acyltransferase [Actinomycetaceae bacterium]|nr:acyltransferase [Actinomycetaceae bacterium]MDY6082331.1 acyltransferase [Actinomycetaceae bacterium]
MTRIVHSAQIGDNTRIGDGCAIWDYAQIRENAVLGENCVIGRGAYIDSGVHVGNNCKIQNYALVYEPAQLADGVFIGPAAVLTNDQWPRAVNPDGTLKSASDWEAVGVVINEGSAVGARAVCVAPVTIGAWATIGSGAVVTHDVPDYALMVGVPARHIGWVGRAGVRLEPVADQPGKFRCPITGETYTESDGKLRRDTDEHEPGNPYEKEKD